MFYEQAVAELSYIDSQIKKIQEKLKSLPTGNFYCVNNSNHIKWFVWENGKGTYIPKKNKATAKAHAEATLLNKRLLDFIAERQSILCYLEHHKEAKNERILLEKSGVKELLFENPETFRGHFSDPFLDSWASQSYISNPKNPEQKIHLAVTGDYVRSKSEKLLIQIVYDLKIPFRYEAELNINGVSFYPDLTLLHPHTKELYYYEHFGMMDKKDYRDAAQSKLKFFSENGIYIGKNLICSYETKDFPFNDEQIRSNIKHSMRL